MSGRGGVPVVVAMITPTALTSTDALRDTVTTLQTSGGSLSWQMIALGVLALIVIAFIVWYLFFRQTPD